MVTVENKLVLLGTPRTIAGEKRDFSLAVRDVPHHMCYACELLNKVKVRDASDIQAAVITLRPQCNPEDQMEAKMEENMCSRGRRLLGGKEPPKSGYITVDVEVGYEDD
jgi:hypothetical protein